MPACISYSGNLCHNRRMFTIAIQAGGQSSRMGEDKALRTFLGRPLIERVIARLRPVASELIVTTNRPEAYAFLGLPLFRDLKPDRGALGGLYTALACATSPLVGVAACDMPFASADLFQAAGQILLDEGADVAVARMEVGYEPLHAVYRRATCLPAIEAAIDEGLWKVVAWFPKVRVRILELDELHRWDPSGRAFSNVNTPEEFADAERLALADD